MRASHKYIYAALMQVNMKTSGGSHTSGSRKCEMDKQAFRESKQLFLPPRFVACCFRETQSEHTGVDACVREDSQQPVLLVVFPHDLTRHQL